MAEQKNSGTPKLEDSQSVERIRDIIFGAHIRDYELRFNTLQIDLNRLQQELDRLAEQLSDQGSDFNKKLQTLRRDMRETNDMLRTELRQTADKLTYDKVDRLTLGELLIQMGNQLKGGDTVSDVLSGLTKIE
ncbi:MAG TPA: hypothetical protein PKE64_02930 [Anaerolineae bacterium]|nr:hypothetical protein [Anaerolineae bacterium]